MFDAFLQHTMTVKRTTALTEGYEQRKDLTVVHQDVPCYLFLSSKKMGLLDGNDVAKMVQKKDMYIYTLPKYTVKKGDIIECEGSRYTVEDFRIQKYFSRPNTLKIFICVNN